MIGAKLIFFYFRKLIRHVYWLYRISKIKYKGNLIINFPFICEGRGKIRVGSNSRLGHHSVFGVDENASLEVGDGFALDENVTIKLGKNASLKLGNNCAIERYTRIYVNNEWIWGDNVWVNTSCQIFSREPNLFGRLNIGNGSNIGDNTIIDLSDDVIIGNEVAIGPNCVIYSHDHVYISKNVAAWKGGVKTSKVIIEDGAWIGSGVTIMPGIKIGSKSVIAAGAVVTKNVESSCVYAGVPAKRVKEIF